MHTELQEPDIFHQHLIIRARVAAPPQRKRPINRWFRTLITDIGMKILHGPVSVYCPVIGNRGMTSFAIIETSHLVLHSWDEITPAVVQFDCYTCSALDVDIIFAAMAEFQTMSMEYKFLDRQASLTEVTTGYLNPKLQGNYQLEW